ncbi:MAG: PilN domain-containing protein [Bacillota bacterium]
MYRVNLLPPELRPKMNKGSNFKLALPQGPGIWLALGLAILVIFYGIFLLQLHSTQSKVDQTRTEIDNLKPVLSRVENARKKAGQLGKEAEAYQKLLDERRSWYGIIEDVGAVMPTDVWLTEVTSDDAGVLDLKCRSASFGSVGSFVYQLSILEYFKSVTLKSVDRVLEGTTEMINFEIVATLAPKGGS